MMPELLSIELFDSATCPHTEFYAPLLAQAVLGWSWRRGVTARLRGFAWAALALYAFGTYSEVRRWAIIINH